MDFGVACVSSSGGIGGFLSKDSYVAPTSNNYEAWISRMGEINISANALPDTENVGD